MAGKCFGQTSRNQTCVGSKIQATILRFKPLKWTNRQRADVENGLRDPTRNPQSCKWLGSMGATQEEDGLSLVSLATDSQSHILFWRLNHPGGAPATVQPEARILEGVQFSGFQNCIVLLPRPETATAEDWMGVVRQRCDHASSSSTAAL